MLPLLATASAEAAPDRPGATSQRSTLLLRLRVRIARCDNKSVRSETWVARQVAAARRIYRGHGVDLRATVDHFSPARCELLTRADRDGMGVYVDRPGVTVLVLRRVRDVDLPSYNLMGVHWRQRGSAAKRRWIFLTARARPPVLAHELGHYLGLPHDPRGGNLMTPGPSDPIWRRARRRPAPFAPRFTTRQARRIRRAVRQLTASAAPPRPSSRPSTR